MAKKPKILSCSENSRTFKVLMPNNWYGEKIHIDGDVITEQTTKKCDYAFKVLDEVKTRYALIYVELKGDDLAQAISQLEDTIKYFQHNTEYLAFADQMPEPVGGLPEIYKMIQYPEIAKRAGVQGKVYVMAFINEEGGVDDVKVIKGIGAGCDEATVEAVKKAKFVPAQSGGKPAKVKMSMQFQFQLK